MDKKIMILSTCVLSGVAFGAGAVSGYLIARRGLQKKFIDQSNQEIVEAKNHYEAKFEEAIAKFYEDRIDPRDVVQPPKQEERIYYNTLHSYQNGEVNLPDNFVPQTLAEQKVHDTAQQIVQSIFRQPEAELDYSAEDAQRSYDVPYIIGVEEFMSNETGYAQETLTYFMGDQTLADSQDRPVEDLNRTIGLHNLVFGHRSNDPNVVYIRNDRLSLEFEVLHSSGKFAVEVLGFVENDQHQIM